MTTNDTRSDHTEDADTKPEPASGSARYRRGTLFAVAASLALVDLILKELAQARLTTPVDLGLLELRLAYNPGVAFSLGQTLPDWLVLVTTAIITLGVAGFAYATAGKADAAHRLGLAAILAGAVANVIDRIGDGVVTDYLHTGWSRPSTSPTPGSPSARPHCWYRWSSGIAIGSTPTASRSTATLSAGHGQCGRCSSAWSTGSASRRVRQALQPGDQDLVQRRDYQDGAHPGRRSPRR